jgi:hypothetical protein
MTRIDLDEAAAPGPDATAILKSLPPCPGAFVPDGFEPNGAWAEGYAEIKAAGIDDSGARKGLAALRPLAWGIFVIGGNLSQERGRLQELQHSRATAVSRLERLKTACADLRLIEEAEGEIRAAEKSIAALTPILEAGSTWAGKDGRVLQQELAAAQGKVDELAARITPYRLARLPFPVEWENSLFQAQRELAAAGSAFAAGRKTFDALSVAAREARERAFAAIRTSLGNAAKAIGQAARHAVEASEDLDLFVAFPHRAPDELLGFFSRAEKLAGIVDRLGGGPHLALHAFWSGVGEGPGEEVVRGKLRAGRSFSRPVEKGDPPLPSHAQILGEVF